VKLLKEQQEALMEELKALKETFLDRLEGFPLMGRSLAVSADSEESEGQDRKEMEEVIEERKEGSETTPTAGNEMIKMKEDITNIQKEIIKNQERLDSFQQTLQSFQMIQKHNIASTSFYKTLKEGEEEDKEEEEHDEEEEDEDEEEEEEIGKVTVIGQDADILSLALSSCQVEELVVEGGSVGGEGAIATKGKNKKTKKPLLPPISSLSSIEASLKAFVESKLTFLTIQEEKNHSSHLLIMNELEKELKKMKELLPSEGTLLTKMTTILNHEMIRLLDEKTKEIEFNIVTLMHQQHVLDDENYQRVIEQVHEANEQLKLYRERYSCMLFPFRFSFFLPSFLLSFTSHRIAS
jgi:hypothetical protein